MGWQGIRGHDAVAATFARAQAAGRIAGSYLFIGPAGVGKATFARALAGALVCQAPRPGLVACGSCGSCLQAVAGTHPDIDVVEKPADKGTIPLESLIGSPEQRMREGLVWRLLLQPALGGRKVAIILDADHLADEGANCLLKTLEEPPTAAVIILVGTELERQLPTIRSRCQVIRFRPLPAADVAALIEEEAVRSDVQVDAATIRTAAAASGGSLARARLLVDPELTAFLRRLVELLGRRPLHGVELARDTLAFVEAAGKETPPRRAQAADGSRDRDRPAAGRDPLGRDRGAAGRCDAVRGRVSLGPRHRRRGIGPPSYSCRGRRDRPQRPSWDAHRCLDGGSRGTAACPACLTRRSASPAIAPGPAIARAGSGNGRLAGRS